MRRTNVFPRLVALAISYTMLASVLLMPAHVIAATDFVWRPGTRQVSAPLQAPRITTVTTEFTLANLAAFEATFSISFPDLPAGWSARSTPGNTVVIPANSEFQNIPIRVDIPITATAGRRTITIRATRTSGTDRPTADAFLEVILNPLVPAPAPDPACPELRDPGNDFDGAALIRVDREEGHGICSTGDEDWFKFGAIEGKYYTIDIPQQDLGLDLLLELYDENERLLDSNDDFPRDTGVLTDTRPMIQSFRAARNGYYYVRVRDTLGIGGDNLSYRIVIRGESYGQDPVTIPPVSTICNDQYEQDGLPELARTIFPNDRQRGHVICPAGDADWVKFFALAGYTYYVYTDSKPYAGEGNDEVQPGADTLLFLFARDGVTLIDSNNNIAGGTTLDSAVRFTATADGIYFAQVKNVGDIGNMFIRYDIILKACPPEQPGCAPKDLPVAPPPAAPAPAALPPVDQQAAVPPPAPVSPPPFLDAEVPSSADQTALLDPQARTASFADANPAFEKLWQYSDLPILMQRVARGWVWGPAIRLVRTEAYVQATDGLRQVLYFDKGRMELTNPAADPASRGFITSGLLAVEMVTGRMQVGDNEFTQRDPAAIPVAGDTTSQSGPTYASFAGLIGPAADQTGQLPDQALDRSGKLSAYAGPTRTETRLAHFTSGHNIPSVFWEYLNSRGTVYQAERYQQGQLLDWATQAGNPISEAYWARVTVGGVERDVLIQIFERRVLTYTPDDPAGWRVQMGNIGRHYYLWRYGEELPS